jgi:hypothetical protein
LSDRTEPNKNQPPLIFDVFFFVHLLLLYR